MAVDLLLGLQWGDEGKGKIVDVLTPNYKVIARFQGGPNAGHTLKFKEHKHVLHTIPSGIFRDNAVNVIGNGVVIDPIILQKELDTNLGNDYIPNPHNGYQFHTQADISSSIENLNFHPKISLEDGIKAYIPEIKRLHNQNNQ